MDNFVKMILHPLVSVVMPVYNAEKHLKEAIESILNQTFSDFEFLIIDDGSTDSSPFIIQSFQDKRIRCIRHDYNKGLIFSLNEGMKEARTEYIVRMDADDISFLKRIEKQVNFFKKNADIDVVGSYFIGLDSNKIFEMGLTHNEIRTQMLFNSTIAHPTIAFRRMKFINNNLFFNSEFKHAEDYELWIRASQYLKFANIPEVLLKYRTHSGQISYQHNEVQLDLMLKCQQMQIEKLGIVATNEEYQLHYSILKLDYTFDEFYATNVLLWFRKISEANSRSKFYDQTTLNDMLHKKWFGFCGHFLRNGCNLGTLVNHNYFNVAVPKYLKSVIFYFSKSFFISRITQFNK